MCNMCHVTPLSETQQLFGGKTTETCLKPQRICGRWDSPPQTETQSAKSLEMRSLNEVLI